MTTQTTTEQQALQKVQDMIRDNRAAMLVTHNRQGGLVSRPMTVQEQEFDGDLWFFVSQDSDVVVEIRANPEVNVAYSQNGNYVSLSGKASIENNMAKKQELWHPELKHWFDGKGPEAPEVTLIKVDAASARYWDSADGPIGEAVNALKAMISGSDGSPINSGSVNY